MIKWASFQRGKAGPVSVKSTDMIHHMNEMKEITCIIIDAEKNI